MGTSNSEGKRKRLTPLGYFVSIGGMLLAVVSYFLLGIDRFFASLRGVLGLTDVVWAFIGDMIWLLLIMAIVSIVVVKLGMIRSD